MPLTPTWAQVPVEAGGIYCYCFITLNPIKKKSVSHSSDPPGSLPGVALSCWKVGFSIKKLLSLGDWLSVGGSSLHVLCDSQDCQVPWESYY